ncbi:hypothetical protein D2T29_12485 [Sinirhodobacter populi]|uniref:Uncharacterized protein n=1 Tax=Paenirhodobacter populi TaxID=2306993 RepID=A0A443KCW9_9RHOB|nr:hypothetical protein [Sinirhodobacter populi]RWR30482.1 hypothetical protein D2T29_12485 [Sinirhodobacter populi]
MQNIPTEISAPGLSAELIDGAYYITSDWVLKERLKAIPGSRWDRESRKWIVDPKWHSELVALSDALLLGNIEELPSPKKHLQDFDWIGQSGIHLTAAAPFGAVGFREAMRKLRAVWSASQKCYLIMPHNADALLEVAFEIDAAVQAAKACSAQDISGRRTRVLWPSTYLPEPGLAFFHKREWRVVTGSGKAFAHDGRDDPDALFRIPQGTIVHFIYSRPCEPHEIKSAQEERKPRYKIIVDKYHAEQLDPACARERNEASPQSFHRFLVRVSDHNMFVGAMWIGGAWGVVSGYGKPFKAKVGQSVSLPDGHLALTVPEEMVSYAYLRPATDPEVNTAQDRAMREAEALHKTRRHIDAINAVECGDLAPHTGMQPDGAVIWRDDSGATQGVRKWIVRGIDGFLYHLTEDRIGTVCPELGNAGYFTVARRVPLSKDLIEAIRG